jgi:hypothetical protein
VRLVVLLITLFFANTNYAQLIDTLSYHLSKKPKLDLRLDSRNGLISNQHTQVFGIKLGLNHGKSVKYGIGYNRLNTQVYRGFGINTYEFHLEYIAPYFEYSFFASNRWEIGIPIQLGVGRGFYSSDELAVKDYRSSLLVLYEPMMNADYYFMRYFTVGIAIGYRLALYGGFKVPEKITSPTYAVRFNILLGKIYRDIRAKKEA